MNWHCKIKPAKPGIIRKRRLFCWVPRVGSDRRWHWLETIERWERNEYVLDEKTGRVIYIALGELGSVEFALQEGTPKYPWQVKNEAATEENVQR